jgi:hypothetical protein
LRLKSCQLSAGGEGGYWESPWAGRGLLEGWKDGRVGVAAEGIAMLPSELLSMLEDAKLDSGT